MTTPTDQRVALVQALTAAQAGMRSAGVGTPEAVAASEALESAGAALRAFDSEHPEVAAANRSPRLPGGEGGGGGGVGFPSFGTGSSRLPLKKCGPCADD